MTEAQLRTATHGLGYGLTALFMAALALQNLRYGFYGLFYLGAAITLLAACGMLYTIVVRRQQLSARLHLPILSGLTLVTGIAQFAGPHPETSHWLFPLILLNFLILPLWQALILSATLLLALTLRALILMPTPDAVMLILAGAGLVALAAYFNGRHTHMVQSAETLAITDSLTGAHNARFLDETLQKELSRSRATGHPMAVIRLRIDHLAEIGNLHGTTVRQRLRRDVAESLFSIIRAGDTLYALDDDDFFLVLPFTPEEGVRVIVERIRRTIRDGAWPPVGRVTVSLGCTIRQDTDTQADTVMARAESALDRACQEGTDRAWFQAEPEPES
ncbi:diguanylate cyclase (GGDEF)-like protein [Tamilnaduibacter salinus]|uniref:diguanylate cyclase n=1 Tax=Tamilnaduibacter salinus TaxID=1484056 RepID=A0A2A2I1W3_9GAMM|nr:GGDEF domain-containing protein [Tamilnaduibacter salinus]PAV26011.1 GGDEF domain-containing protein [Tamilnaduibacter salinus]PVY78856.1 diguanylate cyclase (GGDEF)-like protein [Tamilnaduibacter salinus]